MIYQGREQSRPHYFGRSLCYAFGDPGALTTSSAPHQINYGCIGHRNTFNTFMCGTIMIPNVRGSAFFS